MLDNLPVRSLFSLFIFYVIFAQRYPCVGLATQCAHMCVVCTQPIQMEKCYPCYSITEFYSGNAANSRKSQREDGINMK